jgi:O-antigen/teichoic acid export membrane protein
VTALFTPAGTRVLGPSQFGLVAASIAVMQVVVAIAAVNLHTAVQRRYAGPGGQEDARRLITLAGVISLLVWVLTDRTGPTWSAALGLGPYPPAVRYAVAWGCISAVTFAALGLLRSRDQLLPFAIVSFTQSVVAEALSLVLVLVVHRSASEYVLGELIAQAAAVTMAIAYVRPLPLRAGDARMVGGALWYSIPLVPASLAVFVLEASDRLVIQHDLGLSAVARYSVAYNIGSIPLVLIGALNTFWMPRVFALFDSRVRDSVLVQSRNALYALLIPVVAGLGIGAPVLLHAWAPASYRPDDLLVVVALVTSSSIALAGAMSHTRTLLVEGRTLPVGLATVIAAVVHLVLNVVLVPELGIEGSALATLVGYVALHASLATATRRGRPLPLPPAALAAKLAAATVIAFAAAWLPVGLPFLGLRLVLALGCLLVFAEMMLTLAGRCASRRMHGIATWMMSRALPAAA